MEKGPGIPPGPEVYRQLIGWWFALTRRKIRILHAGDTTAEGPALFAVSHSPGLLSALVLGTAMERPVQCLLPESLARGALARFLTRRLGIILYEGERPASEATLRAAIDVLASGGALVVFADQTAAGQSAPGTFASTAATLVGRAEAQQVGRRVSVYPVHLFLPESAAPSREILIYVDSAMVRPEGQPGALSQDGEPPALAAAIESRFQENAFQLRPADLEYFLSDLEEVLRTGLQEDWASRPDWKQDAEGFVLSRLVTEWVKQTNYLNPGRLVSLRKSLDDYRRLQRQCSLRELEVELADFPRRSGWRQALVWLEMLLGLPIALYGLLNHWAIGLVLLLAGSFKRDNLRARSTEWTLRGAVTLGFYAVQIFLVAHWRGRAAAGYYAPTLPVSGAYLWRYVALVQPQARVLFISLTIPALTKKNKRLRHALLEELDRTLAAYEERTNVQA
jgi:1-acyl-sn-glycerol-3-phosphate acyltransferase